MPILHKAVDVACNAAAGAKPDFYYLLSVLIVNCGNSTEAKEQSRTGSGCYGKKGKSFKSFYSKRMAAHATVVFAIAGQEG
jgi:hypothetical protein